MRDPKEGVVTLADTNSHGDRNQIAYGFWRGVPGEDHLPDPRDFVEEDWDRAERERLAEALDAGDTSQGYRGWANCRICGKHNGSRDLTDGTYVYPQGLGHYVREHGVRVPADMQERALSRKVGDAQMMDASEGPDAGVLSAPGFFESLWALRREKGTEPEEIPYTSTSMSESEVQDVLISLGIDYKHTAAPTLSQTQALGVLRNLGIDPRPTEVSLANLKYANVAMPEKDGVELDYDPHEGVFEAWAESLDGTEEADVGNVPVCVSCNSASGWNAEGICNTCGQPFFGAGVEPPPGGFPSLLNPAFFNPERKSSPLAGETSLGNYPGSGGGSTSRHNFTLLRSEPIHRRQARLSSGGERRRGLGRIWGGGSGGWWGGAWDGFCADCYSPFCLCDDDDSIDGSIDGSIAGSITGSIAGSIAGAMSSRICATCGAPWNGVDRVGLSGTRASEYAQALIRVRRERGVERPMDPSSFAIVTPEEDREALVRVGLAEPVASAASTASSPRALRMSGRSPMFAGLPRVGYAADNAIIVEAADLIETNDFVGRIGSIVLGSAALGAFVTSLGPAPVVNAERAVNDTDVSFRLLYVRWAELLGWIQDSANVPEIRSQVASWQDFKKEWDSSFFKPSDKLDSQALNLSVAESHAASHGYLLPKLVIGPDGQVTRDPADAAAKFGMMTPGRPTTPHYAAKSGPKAVVRSPTMASEEARHPVATWIDTHAPDGTDDKKDPLLAMKLVAAGVAGGLALVLVAKLVTALGDAGAEEAVDDLLALRAAQPCVGLGEAVRERLGRGGGGHGGSGHGGCGGWGGRGRGWGGHSWGNRGWGRGWGRRSFGPYWAWGGGGYWWGGPWDGYCEACYGPFCLCGVEGLGVGIGATEQIRHGEEEEKDRIARLTNAFNGGDADAIQRAVNADVEYVYEKNPWPSDTSETVDASVPWLNTGHPYWVTLPPDLRVKVMRSWHMASPEEASAIVSERFAHGLAGFDASNKMCATCGAPWKATDRGLGEVLGVSRDEVTKNFVPAYVSEIAKLRQERGQIGEALLSPVISVEEDRSALVRMGLSNENVEKLSIGASFSSVGKKALKAVGVTAGVLAALVALIVGAAGLATFVWARRKVIDISKRLGDKNMMMIGPEHGRAGGGGTASEGLDEGFVYVDPESQEVREAFNSEDIHRLFVENGGRIQRWVGPKRPKWMKTKVKSEPSTPGFENYGVRGAADDSRPLDDGGNGILIKKPNGQSPMSGPVRISTDGGQTWHSAISGDIQVGDAVVFSDGMCARVVYTIGDASGSGHGPTLRTVTDDGCVRWAYPHEIRGLDDDGLGDIRELIEPYLHVRNAKTTERTEWNLEVSRDGSRWYKAHVTRHPKESGDGPPIVYQTDRPKGHIGGDWPVGHPLFGSDLRAPGDDVPDVGAASDSSAGILAQAVRDRTYQPIVWIDSRGPDGMTITHGTELLKAAVPGMGSEMLRLPVSWDETKSVSRSLSDQIGEEVIAFSKRLADAVYAAAPIKTAYKSPVERDPVTGATKGISTIGDAQRFNAEIDRQIAAKGGSSGSFHSGAEKLWVLDARLDPKVNAEFLSRTGLPAPSEPRAMNYGGWTSGGQPQQPVSGVHNYAHSDISQLYRPLKRWAKGKDGGRVDLLAWIEKNEHVSPKYTADFKSGGVSA